MEVFWILLLASSLLTNNILCDGSDETTTEPLEETTPRNEQIAHIQALHDLPSNLNHPYVTLQNRRAVTYNNEIDPTKCPCNQEGASQNNYLNQSGLQRLVLYLYYSELTNQLQVLVPNQSKQKLIPDVYDVSDVLEPVENPCLVEVFNKYIDLTKPNNGEDYDLSEMEQKTARRDNDEVSHSTEPPIPIRKFYGLEPISDELIENPIDVNKYLPPPSYNHKQLPVQDPQIVSSEYPSNKETSNNSPNIAYKPVYIPNSGYRPKHVVKKIYTKPTNSEEEYDPFNDIKNRHVMPPGLMKYQFPKHQERSNYNEPNNEWIGDVYPNNDRTDNILNSQKPPLKSTIYNTYPIDIVEPEPFDSWLQNEAKKLLNPNKGSSIDIDNLRYLIKGLLRSKGMEISKDGFIVDKIRGNINMDTMALRPILIGKPVDLKQIMETKSKKLNLSNTPYAKAVLLTSSDPTKVIGLMPLGETYLPRGEFTYSGEVDDSMHDYNVPSVPLYKPKRTYYKVNGDNSNSENIMELSTLDEYNPDQPKTIQKKALRYYVAPQYSPGILSDYNFAREKLSTSDEYKTKQPKTVKINGLRYYLSPKFAAGFKNDHYNAQDLLHRSSEESGEVQENGNRKRKDHQHSEFHGLTKPRYYRPSLYPLRRRTSIPDSQENNVNDLGTLKSESGQLPYVLDSDILDSRPADSSPEQTTEKVELDDPKIEINNSVDLYPGFRIIGGHAATSSGSPLNNKGRSGKSKTLAFNA